jgi:hypothetical protein
VHLLGAEEEVVAAVLGLEEAEAVRVALDAALDEAGLVRDEDGAAAVAHDLAFALHGRKAPGEGFALVGFDPEQGGEAVLVEGDAFAIQHSRIISRLGRGFSYLAASRSLWGSACRRVLVLLDKKVPSF